MPVTLPDNGKLLSNDELKVLEEHILNFAPPSMSERQKRELFAADPTIRDKLPPCWGNGCSGKHRCGNCVCARRYMALSWLRLKHGGYVHPKDVAGYDDVPPDESTTTSDELEEVDAMDLKNAEELAPLETLSLLGQPGLIIKGGSALLSAGPKDGKTDLTYHSTAVWLKDGETVDYLTEESRLIWQHRLRDPDIINQRGLRLVFGMGMGAEKLLERVANSPATIVVADTLRGLGILGEDENDNSKVARALEPWLTMCRNANKTFIGNVHDRKVGGTHGRNVSGAHSLVGAVDVLLHLRRGNGDNQRIVEAIGRLIQPCRMIYERLADGTMRVISAPEGGVSCPDIVGSLPGEPPGWTSDDIVRECKVRKETAIAEMTQAIKDKRVKYTGKGVKGSPRLYYRA